jgi:dTDP-4-dehydrorhamnose reductase
LLNNTVSISRVLVIGKSGQLASELSSTLPKNIEFLALGRDNLDITSLVSVDDTVNKFSPELIINTSAYTAVDVAESNSEDAYAINELAVKNLAKIAAKYNIRLIHVSTDFVFDGAKNTTYKVDDKTNPLSVYGASKLAGEKAALYFNPSNTSVVRTSWLYSSYGNNFVKTMLRLMNEKEEMGIVCDQIGSPTSAKGLAEFIWVLASQEKLSPIYHWSDLGIASWYDFAFAIQGIAIEKGLLGKKIPLKPIASSEYPTPAKRPVFSVLNTTSSQKMQKGRHWRENLALMISSM